MTTTYRHPAATPADIPAITAIYAEAVRRGHGELRGRCRRTRPRWRAGLRALVARRLSLSGAPSADGGVLGYGYAGPYRPRPAYRYTVEDSIYLAAERPRPGHRPARCSRRLIDECTARGFRQMVAVIGDSANDASIRLHKAAGLRAWSARSRTSATSTAAGSTAC